MKTTLLRTRSLVWLALCGIVFVADPSLAQDNPAQTNSADVKITKEGQLVHVSLGDQRFTTLDPTTYGKPILFPIYGPGQIGMTRNWPMVDGVQGEARDHPHHKSMWISHEFNGIDFWSERGGQVVTKRIETEFADDVANAIRISSDWFTKGKKELVLSSQFTFWFSGDLESRAIDCLVTFKATGGELRFEDTKEGMFALRTHPDLRLTPNKKAGVKEVFGSAVNSEGIEGKAIWGKPAKWVLYKGRVGGNSVSLLMFDHPSNLRHPTTWHARDYGLIAANPFGMHHFLGKPKGANDVVLNKGESLSLRFGVEFHSGELTIEQAESRYAIFAKKQMTRLNSKSF